MELNIINIIAVVLFIYFLVKLFTDKEKGTLK